MLSFRPTAPLAPALLAALPGVTRVEESDGRVLVSGSGAFADEVTGLLARQGIVVTGLRIHERNLDDAYLSLTNRQR
jgi:ABC-2 type transport system ATP-binding protein